VCAPGGRTANQARWLIKTADGTLGDGSDVSRGDRSPHSGAAERHDWFLSKRSGEASMSTQQPRVPVTVDVDGTPIMLLALANHSPVTAITVCGELDCDTAPHLTKLVERVAAGRPEQVIIDMANVSFFGAAGVTALLRANDIITGAGGRLRLRSPSPQTHRILAITAIDDLFQPSTSDVVS
jgi:anti-anti-sigma factor